MCSKWVFQFLESSPLLSGLLLLLWSAGDFRTPVFGLCFCKRGLALGHPSFLQTAEMSEFCSYLSDTAQSRLCGGFPMVTQRLGFYFLKLILYAIWHFRKMKCFEKVDCMPRSATLLAEHSFRQTCLKKFEFWWGQLKFDRFRKHWTIGEAFCRVDRLDRLVFLFP